jgi:hypothetical protein
MIKINAIGFTLKVISLFDCKVSKAILNIFLKIKKKDMKIITSSLSKKVTSLNRIQKTEIQWYRDHPFQNHYNQGNEFLYVKLEVIVKELAFLRPHRPSEPDNFNQFFEENDLFFTNNSIWLNKSYK